MRPELIASMRHLAVILCLLLVASCSDIPEIDSYFTFDLTHNASFAIDQNTLLNKASITVSLSIDTAKDYTANNTRTDLLRSAKVTRVQLVSSEQSFNFGALSSAVIMIANDTVADGIYVANGEYLLHAIGKDITHD